MQDVTQYNSPAQASFISTYSPIPFSELMQAGTIKAKQYDQGIENLMQTYDDTNNLKYIPNSKDEQYIKGVVVPHVKSVIDKYSNEDLSDPIIRRQLRMELNNGIDKQRIRSIQDSFEGYKQYIGEKMKLQQKNMLSPLEGIPHKDWDTSTQGTFQQLPSEWSDPIKELQERYFKGLETQIVRDKRGNPITDPRGYYTAAITANRIDQESRTNLANALATPAGRNAVALYRQQYGQSVANKSDAEVLYDAMLDAGHKYIQDKIEGSPWTERELSGRDKPEGGQFFKIEKTPVVSTDQNRAVKSTDFDLKKSTKLGGWYSAFNPSITGTSTNFNNKNTNVDLPHTVNEFDRSVLDKPEVQNIIKLMPKSVQDKFLLVKDEKWMRENPELGKSIQADLYGKLKNTYNQIEKQLQEGSYLAAYYPKAIEGIKESQLNNVDNQTKYIFGTDELKKLGSGNVANREFIDPETGKSYNGKDFYEKVITKEYKNNEDGLIKVTGEYHYEHPFVAMTNNDNFSNAYQVSVNGKQYIMSGEEKDYSDSINTYKKNANKSYTLTHFNPGIPIDENDGTLKIYNNGVYEILDKNTNELLSHSNNFDKAYNDAVKALSSKK